MITDPAAATNSATAAAAKAVEALRWAVTFDTAAHWRRAATKAAIAKQAAAEAAAAWHGAAKAAAEAAAEAAAPTEANG